MLQIDVDNNEDVATRAQISAMPTFKFYKDGKEVDELVGASEAKLKSKLENLTR